jgi:HEAT repeat protein
MFWRLCLVLVTVGALALPAPAGFLFGKKTKPNPAQRVPELIVIVKTDKDESKRASAAEELRQYDPKANADIVPILIDVLLNDAKPAVRVEAAESLGKLRPISQEAGWALEQAKEKDSSMRVRAKARYELLGYYWAGYHSDPKTKDGPAANPKDVAAEKGKPPRKAVINPLPVGPKTMVTPVSRPAVGETPPPPLADPTPKPAPKKEPAPLPVIPLPPDGGPSLPGPGGD